MNEILRTLQTKLGCDVNDSAAPLSEHAWQDGTGAEERAAKIRSDHLVPHFRRHVREVGLGENASVVNEDVNAAELFQHGINHALHVALLGNISLDRNGLLTERTNGRNDLLGGARTSPVVDSDARSRCSKRLSDTSANTPTCPGYQSDFAAQIHAFPRLVAPVAQIALMPLAFHARRHWRAGLFSPQHYCGTQSRADSRIATLKAPSRAVAPA